MSHEPLAPERYDHLTVDDHLDLRAVADTEAGVLYDLVDSNRQYLAEYLPWATGNAPADSLDFIQRTRQHRIDGSEYGFGIYVDEVLVGHISLMHITEGQQPEIGYWVSGDSSGAGNTTKAAVRVAEFGLSTLGLESIVIKAAEGNIASNKIAHKLGFVFSGVEESDNGTIINVWRKNNES
ncbi:MAG TPA: GNAT family N-acetyltransferase [Candidatus Saccharibacteria bacterium]|jgi:ribosomal-protein-serine acetyltransferase|nr:ribosomal-protein-serine acetyltransferase [Patescibacteria group bacterium]HMS31003.1 GNAT family N-acetyltransferase [Candidatus Saccharibacteria bacterium]